MSDNSEKTRPSLHGWQDRQSSQSEETRPSFHSPMFLKQYGKLHYEPLGGYGKVEINYDLLDAMDDVMILDVVQDWILELDNYRQELHDSIYEDKI